MINKDKHLRLFECCIPVKGYRHSIIMDTQRQKIKFVPNDLINIIQKNGNKSIESIISELNEDDQEIVKPLLQGCVNYILEQEIDKDKYGSYFPTFSI